MKRLIMKKIFYLVTLLLLSVIGFSQPVVNRAGIANTVSDYRLQASLNLYIPRYVDTVSANFSKGVDSCGAIIYVYSTNNYLYRACNPKRWVVVGGRFGLEDNQATSTRAFDLNSNTFTIRNGKFQINTTTSNTLSISSNAGTETGVIYTPDGTVLKIETKNSAGMTIAAGSQISFQPAQTSGGQIVMDGSVSNFVSTTHYTNGGGLLARQGIGVYSVPNQESEFYLKTFNYYDPVLLDSQYTYLTLYNKMKFINIPNDDTTSKIITIDGANNVRYRNASTISGGSGGIHGVYAGYGLTKVNDSTLKADTTVGTGLIGYLRYIKLKDSIASVYTPMARVLSNGYGISSIGDLSANRTVTADTTVGVGLIGWPRFVKLKDSISAIYQVKGNYITATTGDVLASGPGSAAATLATVNSNVGSFTNASITVNGKGLITAASSGSVGSSFTFKDSLQWLWASNYGVVFDGVTDNAAALKALASAQRSTNRVIAFGPGVVYSSDSVTWTNAVLMGYRTTIKSTSNTVTIFNIQDSCDVSGFTFIGNGKAAALPGGVFTTQDGIRMFGTKNRIHDNRFISMNGSGVNIWAGACCGYRNLVYSNFFTNNTIGIFAMTNSEYLTASNNQGEFNLVGIYDRSSSNNRWVGNDFQYSVRSNFRLMGNGDHGGAWSNTFNHGNVYNVEIESCTLNYVFADNIVYTGNITFGTVDTVHNFNWSGGTVSGATITGSKVVNVVMQGFTEGSTPNTRSTTGVVYVNNLNSTDPIFYSSLTGSITSASLLNAMSDETGTAGNLVFSGSPTIATPTFTTRATSPIITGSSAANGTLTLEGNNAGSSNTAANSNIILRTGNTPTNALVINNAQEIGIGTNPATGFKLFIVSAGNGAGTNFLLGRNSSSNNIIQIDDAGSWRLGNQSATASTGMMMNKTFAGGGTVIAATAWMHLAAGTAPANTAPLKFTAGTNLATTEAGAIEYDGAHLYFTAANAGTRYQLDQQAGGVTSVTGTANQVLANGTSGSAQTGAVTLTTPQDIATTSNVQFGSLGVGASPQGSLPVNINKTTIGPVGGNAYIVSISGTLQEASTGTHGTLASVGIFAPGVTSGSATVTRAATFNITGAPAATVTDANYSIIVDAGWSQFSGFGAKLTTISADITLSDHYTVLVDASGANRTITLPAAVNNVGRIFVIKKIDASANTVTIDGNASETIDGATTQVISTQWASMTIQSNGANWFVLNMWLFAIAIGIPTIISKRGKMINMEESKKAA